MSVKYTKNANKLAMPENIDKFGKCLRILREAKGLSSGELAKKTGISPSLVSMIEKGNREPNINVLVAISAALDVPVDFLIQAASSSNESLIHQSSKSKRLASALDNLLSAEKKLESLLSNRRS